LDLWPQTVTIVLQINSIDIKEKYSACLVVPLTISVSFYCKTQQ